ncbi:hypothetical protein [uncultured Clostridium sp.]|uniref:hypothetical protein n=1 Tax=uncultured Clostridium sp. TaxID=59620 RepID=UPI0025D03183|nr:hypothetical protein [uncultured Clostridium sp.]
MFKFDHFIINIDEHFQKDSKYINEIIEAGFPYKPSWGKGTKGFKVSNLWIGNEYFEMVNILKKDGGGWTKSWTNLYNNGHRGLVCLMLDVDDLDNIHNSLCSKNINITTPEFLKFKWFFNLFTRTMPWRNSYINFFEGVPLQIGIQQMKDDKSRNFMEEYMVPNSRENEILGIKKVIIKGPFTKDDIKLINKIFEDYIIQSLPITINLDNNQTLIFQEEEEYKVDIFTQCDNLNFKNKKIEIENITIYN